MSGPADRVATLAGQPPATGGRSGPGSGRQVTGRRGQPAYVSRSPLLGLRRRAWFALSLNGAGPVGWRSRDERLLWALNKAGTPDRRAYLPIHIWRWRYELMVVAGLATIAVMVLRTLGLAWGSAVLSGMAGVWSPPWPRWLTYCGWHVITPHRVRVGLARAGIHNRSGWNPLVIRVICEEFGERVVLWCPAGTSAEEVYRARGILRDACWAADVRVTCDVLRSHVVTVDVIRRGEGAARRHPSPGPAHPPTRARRR